MDFKNILHDAARAAEIRLSDSQLEKFEKYYNMLVEWNEKINLTAITEPQGVIEKHFIDCLLLFKYADIPEGAEIIDVGTGAGFPGAVMKIYRSDLKITLLDSLNKRLVFLNELSNELKLGAKIIHIRAEDGGHDPELREKYDVAVSRAVAQLNTLSEYCLPFVKEGGSMYALKGPQVPEEAEEAREAVKALGGRIVGINNYALPRGDGRAVVSIKKIKSTPDTYPRTTAKIKSKPL